MGDLAGSSGCENVRSEWSTLNSVMPITASSGPVDGSALWMGRLWLGGVSVASA